MPQLLIERLAPEAQLQPDLLGLRVTITLPDLPPTVQDCHGLMLWLQAHPEIVPPLIGKLLLLISQESVSPKPQ